MTLPLFSEGWEQLWAGQETVESTGAIFTRSEIVDLILDVSGYRLGGKRLALTRVLEPSCGDGAFVTNLVSRLLASEAAHAKKKRKPIDWGDPVLADALHAGDINAGSIQLARGQVVAMLTTAGCPAPRAAELADGWFIRADFLLHHWTGKYDLVVGNPPYVRVEALPRAVLTRYRDAYATMGDRADIYVAFIERGLELLAPGGRLAYIVANRWTKNLYGRTLRGLIAERYRVATYLNLEHTQPFLSDVSAYPAIVVLDRHKGLRTLAATLNDIEPATLLRVMREHDAQADLAPKPRLVKEKSAAPYGDTLLRRFDEWYPDGSPWLTTDAAQHETLAGLSATLPTLEESAPGTKVGIGVATGADKIFIVKGAPAGVELDRLMPILMPGDVGNAQLSWSGHYLINPWSTREDDGPAVVPLADAPGMAAFFQRHEAALRKRHVGTKDSARWYRTIDRVSPWLQVREKLVMRDIQDPAPGRTTIGYDPGGEAGIYPSHNLYWIISDKAAGWPLRALKALLRSSPVVEQVKAHSVAMRGGSIRWQAQTLRRVRLPARSSLGPEIITALEAVAESSDQAAIDAAAVAAFAAAQG